MRILKFDNNQEGKKKLLPKKPKQINSDPNQAALSDGLFSEYRLDTYLEDALMMATVPDPSILITPEPMMEEENPSNSGWEFDVERNHNSAAPSDSFLIGENSNESEIYSFPKEASEDIDDCWGYESFHAPIKKDTAEIDQIYNMDIVQFALGESDLDGFLSEEFSNESQTVTDGKIFQDPPAIQPVATTTAFMHSTDNLLTIDHPTISLHLPKRQTYLEITEVPRRGSVCLTPDQMRSLKYRRSRDLNIEASKKYKKNKKVKQRAKEQECQELEEKNRMLKVKMLTKQTEVAGWRAKCRDMGYSM